MVRIALMVIRSIFKIPSYACHLHLYGKKEDSHTEQERYDYLRKVVKEVNCAGRVEVIEYGTDNLPEKEGFILFPNHQGLFDSLALIATCSHPFGIVIKKEAARLILVKQVIALLRGIAIDRKDLKDSVRMIKQVTEEVKQGRNYVIFAEGTRSREGNKILPFKSGTFKSAIHAKCPIVPVALINSYKPFDCNSIRREKVEVHYLAAIYPDQYMGLKSSELADLVHDRIQDTIDQNIDKNVEKIG
ncbi:lysophospholipid acyltransferase family protein [Clostridium sp. AM58-1XD]|uniref:lysophospholipid acyltransferase family protein n=1 Tax=Clostridium sp. AM58-1XD TaxID=2292307 RepID=UPI000E52016D|nr:lysophospholipid acyltransferase family protein [Clostridium sp. AM58-1XD]RGY95600.1 1-acyl-sn-glycerol-3-phosphate acyltransferase [Clostridium sp. AM58-1XD]